MCESGLVGSKAGKVTLSAAAAFTCEARAVTSSGLSASLEVQAAITPAKRRLSSVTLVKV
jgi:hypothetical protein